MSIAKPLPFDLLPTDLVLRVPVKVLPIYQEPRRFNVLHGGRGSAKSRSIAQLIVGRCLEAPERVLCCREVQKSMRDSVYRLICDEIERRKVGHEFEILEAEIRCLATGATIQFSGLLGHTVESIKSYEGITICWVEEASSVSARSWEILIPTVRAPGSQFFITFNPDLEDDAVWQMFKVHPPAEHRAHVIELNYWDNPWFDETELPEESAELKRRNPVAWAHVYGGQLRSRNGIIFRRQWARWYNPDVPGETPTGMRFYLASDYAVSPEEGDYTVHVVFGVDHRGRAYLVDCWYGQTDPATWINAALDLVEKWNPLFWFDEAGTIEKSVGGAIGTAMMERAAVGRPAFVTRLSLPSIASKANRAIGINSRKPTLAEQARAMGFAGRMGAGAVYFPRPAPGREWVTWLTEQLWSFHGLGQQLDDAVDACTLFARGLEHVAKGAEPAKKPEDAPAPFTAAWFALREQQRHVGEDDDRKRFYDGG